MIEFYSETDIEIKDEERLARWINHIVKKEDKETGEITYVFCDDEYLLNLNKKYLDHDTLTDIITFDNSVGLKLSGDIFVSIERVKDNAKEYNTTLTDELHRVMIHGVLHLCGYKDKTETETEAMRAKEDEALQILDSL